MKHYKYYDCIITAHSGRMFDNPLRLGEFVTLGQMLRENKRVTVEIKEMDAKTYNATFGTNMPVIS